MARPGKFSAELLDILDSLFAKLALSDHERRDLQVVAVVRVDDFAGGHSERHMSEVGHVGCRGRDPRASVGNHHRDIRGGNVHPVGLHAVLEIELRDRERRALGEFVVRRDNRDRIRIGLKRGFGLVGRLGRGVGVHHADLRHLTDSRIAVFELHPDFVAKIKRAVSRHIHIHDIARNRFAAHIGSELRKYSPHHQMLRLVHQGDIVGRLD